MAAAARSLRERLTSETTGGALLLIAALLGLGWANSPWREAYLTLSRTVIAPPELRRTSALSRMPSVRILPF